LFKVKEQEKQNGDQLRYFRQKYEDNKIASDQMKRQLIFYDEKLKRKKEKLASLKEQNAALHERVV